MAGTPPNKCPAGGVFGKDTNRLPGCKDCAVWDACDDELYKSQDPIPF